MAVDANTQAADKKEYEEAGSFWDRIKAGNIDEKSDDASSAYQRWNPEAKAAREALKAGASKAAEDGIAAGKIADVEPVVSTEANDVKAAHEVAEAEKRKQFKEGWESSAASEKEPGWDTKPDAVVAAPKPVARKPAPVAVAKPATQPVAVKPVVKPVARPAVPATMTEQFTADAQAGIDRDNASKIKLPTAQPKTMKQRFAADNSDIKGVMVDGKPAMRPEAAEPERAAFFGSKFK